VLLLEPEEQIFSEEEEEEEKEEEEKEYEMLSSQGQQPQQPQQQQNEPTSEQIMHYLAQQATAIQQLLQNGGRGIEAVKPPIFEGEREKVAGFINVYCLYTGMKLEERTEGEKIS